MSFRAALTIAAIGILLGSRADGQQRSRVVAEADSAFAAGNIALADSLYFIAARFWPRDPLARTALGRYLGARGKTKPAIVLLEEARMFGGDPAVIGGHLAPLYERLGEWRALLTLPGSPLSSAERRRAAWMSEHAFAFTEGAPATIIGGPKGDTIARVAARVGGRAIVGATMVGADVGFTVGTRLAEGVARRYEGDPTVVTFDSMSVAQVRLVNVPAAVGPEASTLTFGPGAFGRAMIVIDYGKSRVNVTRIDAVRAASRHPMVRTAGAFRVLDRGRWTPLSEFAAMVAKAGKTMVIDVAAGEVRVRF